MRKILIGISMALLIVTLGGCGDNGGGPSTTVTHVLSDPSVDGDIALPIGGSPSPLFGNTQVVHAGVDPLTGTEYRAFLDFPLTGHGGVPGSAIIDSATLDFFIDNINPNPLIGSIPIRIDLVDFPPPIIGSDFDRGSLPALASTTIIPAIRESDRGRHVAVDVTPLMVEAQRRLLPNFQVRILEDLTLLSGQVDGLITIDDTTGPQAGSLAPELEVVYF